MIKLRRVTKAFDGKTVLEQVSWTITPGEKWQITGASGIGKTTLLRLVMGLETPDSGLVLIDPALRFSAVFQEDRLVEYWSAVGNVQLVCKDAGRARAMLNELLPAAAIDRPVRTLSGGMRRRVALVRALAAESDVLVLDEPFSGMDSATAARAWRSIEAHRAGRTLLLVSHGTEQSVTKLKTLRLAGKSAIL